VIAATDERRAVLGYLTDFEEGRYRVTNRLGLELELRWPLELFPAAWFWRSSVPRPGIRGTGGCTTALEPNSSGPAGNGNVRAKEARRSCSAPADPDGDRGGRASARAPGSDLTHVGRRR
jgi:hypothetical protein